MHALPDLPRWNTSNDVPLGSFATMCDAPVYMDDEYLCILYSTTCAVTIRY